MIISKFGLTNQGIKWLLTQNKATKILQSQPIFQSTANSLWKLQKSKAECYYEVMENLDFSQRPENLASRKQETKLNPESLDLLKATSVNKNSLLKIMDTFNVPAPQGFRNLYYYPNRLALYRANQFPPTRDFTIPAVASAIVHRRNPDTPVFYPTAEQIRADLRRSLSGWFFIDVLKPVSKKFNGIIERKGTATVDSIAQQAEKWIGIFERIPSPKQEFLKEMQAIYEWLTDPKLHTSPTEAISYLKVQMQFARSASEKAVSRNGPSAQFINLQDFPLLVSIYRKINPNLAYRIEQAPVHLATHEVLDVMSQFLDEHGIAYKPIPKPSSSLKAYLAHQFKPDAFEKIRGVGTVLLSEIYNLLPDNGTDFAAKIHKLAENIVDAKKQGISDSEIAKHFFASIDEGESPDNRNERLRESGDQLTQ